MERFFNFLYTHSIPIILLAAFYLIGWYITLDYNPTHWVLFTTMFGRVMSVFLFFGYIRVILDWYDQL
jgi:hypothetical protein